MTWQTAETTLAQNLRALYQDREPSIIADWVMEKISSKRKLDRILGNDTKLAESQFSLFAQMQAELLEGRPVQYVLGEADFLGMKLKVDERVLIPRPETEELVAWVLEDCQSATQNCTPVLDLGTGSGCIAIALKKNLPPDTRVYGCDQSLPALELAKENAFIQKTDIEFFQTDFLDPLQLPKIPSIRCLVSNPPYISIEERPSLAPRVREFEPSQALFAPGNDPLIFYRQIAVSAPHFLAKDGSIFLEVHAHRVLEVVSIFESGGYAVTVRKDLQGKDRMVKAILTAN